MKDQDCVGLNCINVFNVLFNQIEVTLSSDTICYDNDILGVSPNEISNYV